MLPGSSTGTSIVNQATNGNHGRLDTAELPDFGHFALAKTRFAQRFQSHDIYNDGVHSNRAPIGLEKCSTVHMSIIPHLWPVS